MADTPLVSVIIPVYNQEEMISEAIESALAQTYDQIEIIVVDNGSTDHTSELLRDLYNGREHFIKVVRVEVNIGYGHGIMSGVNNATGEVIAWTHADLQNDPTDVIGAYETFKTDNQYPYCIMKGRRVGRNLFDAMFTAGMSFLSTVLLRVPLSDVNAQPKMFHRNFLKKLQNPPMDFSLDLYLLYQAQVYKYPILEHHVHFGKRFYGVSKGGGTLKGKLKLIQRTWKYLVKLKGELKR